MKLPHFLFTIFFSVFFLGMMSAQSVVSSTFSAAGGTISNTEHSLHFNVGEPINNLISIENLRLSQGLIQNLLSQLPLGLNSIQLQGVELYPNPATNFLIIENERELQNLKYKLYSIDGKEMKTTEEPRTLSNLKTTLNMKTIPAGNYILNISKDDLYFQNLKLIKN